MVVRWALANAQSAYALFLTNHTNFYFQTPLARMMALVCYVTSWDPKVELIHGECLSVYQTFHYFNEVHHAWYSRQANACNKRDQGDIFTCDATKVATTWSHPCIKHTTGKADSQRSILYCNIQQTHYATVHLKYYTQTKIPSRGANHFTISYKK